MIDKIKIDPRLNFEWRDHGDTGANVAEAYMPEDGVINGFITQRFQGYESQGRKIFTLKDLQLFFNDIVAHKKFRPLARVVIDFFGSRDFNPNTTLNKRELNPPPPKKKHLKVKRDSRGNHHSPSRR